MPLYNSSTRYENTKRPPPNTMVAENEIKEILRKADCNGDGSLSKEELKKAFKEFGSKMPGWRADRLLRKADANHDGVLTIEELDIIVEYALARYNGSTFLHRGINKGW